MSNLQSHQEWQEAQSQLREKIVSKMTVATFLAGFTFAALLELLKDSERHSSSPIQVAVISLTVALALFVAAVYMYDRLSMPRRFWKYQDRSPGNPTASTGSNNPSPPPSDPQAPPSVKPKGERGNLLKRAIEKLHFKIHDVEGLESDGTLYTYMIAIWIWVFTPAVIAALVGFSAILYSTNSKVIFRSGISIVAVVIVYYIVRRPILGKYD